MADKVKNKVLDWVKGRNPNEPEFIQAVTELVGSIGETSADKRYVAARILERMSEPERVISFRVVWQDDAGRTQVNRGYRVQMSSVLGPYKGGLRFHPSVNLSVLKFLAFEQVFKNALTGLPLGGGKGGSDFDPKGKSDAEVMRFCQAFMTELFRHIGPNVDVPAGDIGVGGRELGFLFGQYKKLRGAYENAMSGRGIASGGTYLRTEATGYGVVYFAEEMLRTKAEKMDGKTAIVSGSGNVAQYAVEKLNTLGVKVLTMSDSDGYVYDPAGITAEKLAYVMELKNEKRGRISAYARKFMGSKYHAGKKPWSEKAHLVFPCATQNELDEDDAKLMIKNKVLAVVEGANMPTTLGATKLLQDAGVLFAPGKASNAGGVAVSGLEMSQDSVRLRWSREEVDDKLRSIMKGIHEQCLKHGNIEHYRGRTSVMVDYVKGANRAAFKKVAEAMLAQGLV